MDCFITQEPSKSDVLDVAEVSENEELSCGVEGTDFTSPCNLFMDVDM